MKTKAMNALKFSAVLALLILTEVGRAGPLDTWTWRNPLPTGNDLNGIAYGNGQFVAVGAADTIVTSADGVDWVLRQSGTTDWLSDIAYGNGEVVAVGGRSQDHCNGCWEGTIVTSADGVNWVPRQAVKGFHFYQIAYGNGQFVASGGSSAGPGGILLSSSDGASWGKGYISFSGKDVGGITHGNRQFLAVGDPLAIPPPPHRPK